MLPTTKIDLGNGLRDGLETAGAQYRIRQLRMLGATEIVLARTGRLTFMFQGGKRIYTVTPPYDYDQATAFEAAGTTESPLTRAISDLQAQLF
jgi:hypothetical protein